MKRIMIVIAAMVSMAIPAVPTAAAAVPTTEELVSEIVDALEAYAADHGTFLVANAGFRGNGIGTFGVGGTDVYPQSIKGELIAGGYLRADFHLPDNPMVYHCAADPTAFNRVGVFIGADGLAPSETDELLWSRCTNLPVDRYGKNYFEVSSILFEAETGRHPQLCDTAEFTVDIGLGQSPTEGADIIRGTAGDDEIHGLGGDDVICGFGGADIIRAGDGDDKVFGGDGDDRLYGDLGDDWLRGDDGDDFLQGHRGNDNLEGSRGDDTLSGNDGDDYLNGSAGNDSANGGLGNDLLSGEGGDDRLSGTAGDDRILGGSGNDELFGGGGNDLIAGDSGDDHLTGDSGDDILSGSDGYDQIYGGTGRDHLSGGRNPDGQQDHLDSGDDYPAWSVVEVLQEVGPDGQLVDVLDENGQPIPILDDVYGLPIPVPPPAGEEEDHEIVQWDCRNWR